jgi:hypothetical protein
MVGVHPTHATIVHPKEMPILSHFLSITSTTLAPLHQSMHNEPLHALQQQPTASPSATVHVGAAAEHDGDDTTDVKGNPNDSTPTNRTGSTSEPDDATAMGVDPNGPLPTNHTGSTSESAAESNRSSDEGVTVTAVPHSTVAVTAPPMLGDLAPAMAGIVPTTAMGSDVMPTSAEKAMPTFLPDPFATSPVPIASFPVQVEEQGQQGTPVPSPTPSPSEILSLNHNAAMSKSVAGSPASMNNPHSRLKALLDAHPGLSALFDRYHHSSDEEKQTLELNNPVLRQVRRIRVLMSSGDGESTQVRSTWIYICVYVMSMCVHLTLPVHVL